MYWDGWFPMPLGWILLCIGMIPVSILLIGGGHGRNSALRKLDQRFARGEIGDSEYKAKREAILQL